MVSKRVLAVITVVSTLTAGILLWREVEMYAGGIPRVGDSGTEMVHKTAPPPEAGKSTYVAPDSYAVTLSTTRTAWDAFLDGSVVNTGPTRLRACFPTQGQSRALFAADEVQLSAVKKVTTVISNSTGGAPRGCVVGPYHRDFDHMAARLKDVNGPGLAYVRYADGELGVAQGKPIGNAEWSFGGTDGKTAGMLLQRDLLASLRGHFGQEFYYGFASPYDDANGLKWFLQHTEQACGYISYANIWVNSHFNQTRQLLAELTEKLYYKKVVLVVNKESVEKIKATKDWAADYLPLPDNMPATWDDIGFRADLLNKAAALASKYEGYLFIVSGGPPGKVIAAHMWDTNCRNKYVDFGSSVDPIFRDKLTRGYQNEDTPYAKQVDPMWHVPTHEENPVPRQY
jgi:hypothetical protein